MAPEPGPVAQQVHQHVEHLDVGTSPGSASRLPSPSGHASRSFDASARAPGAARSFLTEVLRSWGRERLTDDAVLVVSELTSNAVFHARSQVTVTVTARPGSIRLSVRDDDPTAPVLQAPGPTDAGGRGLLLVAALSARWGVDELPSGKVVWAELDDRAPEATVPDRGRPARADAATEGVCPPRPRGT